MGTALIVMTFLLVTSLVANIIMALIIHENNEMSVYYQERWSAAVRAYSALLNTAKVREVRQLPPLPGRAPELKDMYGDSKES